MENGQDQSWKCQNNINLIKVKNGNEWIKAQKCFYCGLPFENNEDKKKTREHWIDKAIGGYIIIAVHYRCNQNKSAVFSGYNGLYNNFIQGKNVKIKQLDKRFNKFKSDYFLELKQAINIQNIQNFISLIERL